MSVKSTVASTRVVVCGWRAPVKNSSNPANHESTSPIQG